MQQKNVKHQSNHLHHNKQGEVTSQYLWPQYDRHFVGMTWHKMCGVKGRRFMVLFKYIRSIGLRKCLYDH